MAHHIATPWDLNADRETMLVAAAAATYHSDDISRDRDTIERLGQAIEELDTQNAILREKLFEERLELLKLRNLLAKMDTTITGKSAAEVSHEVAIADMVDRQRRAETVPMRVTQSSRATREYGDRGAL